MQAYYAFILTDDAVGSENHDQVVETESGAKDSPTLASDEFDLASKLR